MNSGAPAIRILAFIETRKVSGPAKNLLQFARLARISSGEESPVDVHIATYLRGRETTNEFIAAAQGAGLPLSLIRERWRFDLKALAKVKALVRESRPHLLQSHNSKSHLFIRALGLHRHVPWIAFHHGYTATNWKDRFYNQFDRWSLPRADRVITVCEAFVPLLRGRGVAEERIRILHNAAPAFEPPSESETEAARAHWKIPKEAPVILSAGRFSREKGHRDLIQAAALLRPKSGQPRFRWILAGDGPEFPALARMVREFGLGGSVIFPGWQDNLRILYALAAVFVLPSHTEGSPNVLLEAMSAGVPVIATRVGGVPELIQDGASGILVPPGNASALAEAVDRLLSNPGLRAQFAAAALHRVQSRHALQTYCRSLMEIYREALAPGAGEG